MTGVVLLVHALLFALVWENTGSSGYLAVAFVLLGVGLIFAVRHFFALVSGEDLRADERFREAVERARGEP